MALTLPQETSLTYLGHATALLKTPGGKTLLLDPWVEHNPRCPFQNKDVGPLDLILISHGHEDHMGDAIALVQQTQATVISGFEVGEWLEKQGVENALYIQKGGSVTVGGIRVTMTHALHSSSLPDGSYGGEPAGFIVTLEDGFRFYFAGDTGLFGDMALIKEIYAPSLAILPIGDHFTMGPFEAAHACRLLGVKHVIPIHFGTFPLLTGTPEAFQAELDRLGLTTEMTVLEPGETIGAN